MHIHLWSPTLRTEQRRAKDGAPSIRDVCRFYEANRGGKTSNMRGRGDTGCRSGKLRPKWS